MCQILHIPFGMQGGYGHLHFINEETEAQGDWIQVCLYNYFRYFKLIQYIGNSVLHITEKMVDPYPTNLP